MTTALSAPATPALADLVLVRMALNDPSPAKVREHVGQIFEAGLSEARRIELCVEMVASGMATKGRGSSFKITDLGRDEVLRILNVGELPAKTSWGNVVAKHLLPKALDLPADAAARLDKADKLAAYILKQKYRLNLPTGGTADNALEAIVCREVGYPGETTLTGLLEAVLGKVVGSDRRLTRKELAAQLPLYQTDVPGPPLKADRLREKLVRDWLRGRDATPHQREAFDLSAFAATVLALARTSPPADRFHDNKVFISALAAASQREPNFPRLTRDEFKQRLLEANARGLLHLSRADLVQAMDPRLVAASETTYLNATFHFVLLEGGAA